jgi:hypothetical protein
MRLFAVIRVCVCVVLTDDKNPPLHLLVVSSGNPSLVEGANVEGYCISFSDEAVLLIAGELFLPPDEEALTMELILRSSSTSYRLPSGSASHLQPPVIIGQFLN